MHFVMHVAVVMMAVMAVMAHHGGAAWQGGKANHGGYEHSSDSFEHSDFLLRICRCAQSARRRMSMARQLVSPHVVHLTHL